MYFMWNDGRGWYAERDTSYYESLRIFYVLRIALKYCDITNCYIMRIYKLNYLNNKWK